MAGKSGKTQPKVVAYYRVSTAKQGASGLGLEAQREAVLRHAREAGARVVGEFTEVESGRKSDRPELAKALAHARLAGATLCIAKLDRLSRNVAFLANLMEGGTPFVCCDNPHATPLTIHILSAVAADEAKRTSERTRDALKAYKARGGTLGSARPECRHNLRPDVAGAARAEGNAAGVRAARRVAAEVGPELQRMRAEGLTLRACAEALNSRGYQTRRGLPWTAVAVLRCLNRA